MAEHPTDHAGPFKLVVELTDTPAGAEATFRFCPTHTRTRRMGLLANTITACMGMMSDLHTLEDLNNTESLYVDDVLKQIRADGGGE